MSRRMTYYSSSYASTPVYKPTLDLVTATPRIAYGSTLLSSAYTGPILNIRNGTAYSTSTGHCDVMPDSYGLISNDSLTVNCTDPTDEGKTLGEWAIKYPTSALPFYNIRILYDQSGNGHHTLPVNSNNNQLQLRNVGGTGFNGRQMWDITDVTTNITSNLEYSLGTFVNFKNTKYSIWTIKSQYDSNRNIQGQSYLWTDHLYRGILTHYDGNVGGDRLSSTGLLTYNYPITLNRWEWYTEMVTNSSSDIRKFYFNGPLADSGYLDSFDNRNINRLIGRRLPRHYYAEMIIWDSDEIDAVTAQQLSDNAAIKYDNLNLRLV